jgi:hypothetical protein
MWILHNWPKWWRLVLLSLSGLMAFTFRLWLVKAQNMQQKST